MFFYCQSNITTYICCVTKTNKQKQNIMTFTRNYLECFITPRLKEMIKGTELSKEEKQISKEIIKERETNFFERVTQTANYHNN